MAADQISHAPEPWSLCSFFSSPKCGNTLPHQRSGSPGSLRGSSGDGALATCRPLNDGRDTAHRRRKCSPIRWLSDVHQMATLTALRGVRALQLWPRRWREQGTLGEAFPPAHLIIPTLTSLTPFQLIVDCIRFMYEIAISDC